MTIRTPGSASRTTGLKLAATLVDPRKGHVDPSGTPQRLAQLWRALLPDAKVVAIERLTKARG